MPMMSFVYRFQKPLVDDTFQGLMVGLNGPG
jgi:hypothetical protein